MKKLILVSVAILVSLAVVPLTAQEVVDLTDDTAEVKEITIENDGLTFVTKEIRARVGDTIRLTFVNTGGFHDWVVDEFNAATAQIPEGSSDTIEFTVDRAGSFEYYCSVSNHRQRGMVGTLIVVE